MGGRELSIGMINYNCHPDLLRLSIASLYAKTSDFKEFLVVDNGSSNGNLDLLDELAARYGRMRVIRRQQEGVGGSFGKGEGCNVLIKEFDSEYASFYENDGFLIENNWDQLLLDRLEERNLLMIGNQWPLVGATNRVIAETFTTFSVFKLKPILDAGINFLPDGPGPSFQAGFDCGCQLARHFSDEVAENLIYRSGREKQASYFNKPGFAEYHYDGRPIFAHFGRGSGHSKKMSSGMTARAMDIARHMKSFLTASKRLKSSNPFSYFESKNKLDHWLLAADDLLPK